MDIPFFRSRWTSPNHPRYYSPGEGARSVPFRKSPRAVFIPVHFVERREGSAVKIQKVFRGLLVRKSVRMIAALRKEVEEVERRVLDPEAVEAMRRDPRERLRVSETLMNVLFRLDSIRGVDSGVREFRKAVIRRVIALQEMIDGITAAAEPAEVVGDRADPAVEEAARADDSGSGEPINQRSPGDSADQRMDAAEHLGGRAGDCDHESVDDRAGIEESVMCGREDDDDEAGEENDQRNMSGNSEIGAADGVIPSMRECSGETRPENQKDSTSIIEAVEENVRGELPDKSLDAPTPVSTKDSTDHTHDENAERPRDCVKDESSRRNKELLEKMAEDNKMMMRMMGELLERNGEQARLLSSLSQRVEQLERALVCEKLRRKKKRHPGGSHSPDCAGASPEYRKLGKN